MTTKEDAKKRAIFLKRLREEHKETVTRSQGLLKAQKAVRREICKHIRRYLGNLLFAVLKCHRFHVQSLTFEFMESTAGSSRKQSMRSSCSTIVRRPILRARNLPSRIVSRIRSLETPRASPASLTEYASRVGGRFCISLHLSLCSDALERRPSS